MRFGASGTPGQYRSVCAAGDDDHVLGHGQHPRALGHLSLLAVLLDVLRREELRARLRRADDDLALGLLPLVLGLDEVERRRRRPSWLRLLRRERSKIEVVRDREALEVERDARDQVALQVVELELRGLADQLRGALLVVDAGQLDDDLVAALLADLRLGDADAVDAVVDDRRPIVEDLPRRRPGPSRAAPSGPPRGRPGGRGRASASSGAAIPASRARQRRAGPR